MKITFYRDGYFESLLVCIHLGIPFTTLQGFFPFQKGQEGILLNPSLIAVIRPNDANTSLANSNPLVVRYETKGGLHQG